MLQSEQDLQKEYYRDQIYSYGIDVIYFRKLNRFFEAPSGYACPIYGEDTTAAYYLSGNMVVYMEMMGDSFLLNKFGIETDAQANIYFTIQDFDEQFRDRFGTITAETMSANLYGNVSGLVSGYAFNDTLTGFVSAFGDSDSYLFQSDLIPQKRKVNGRLLWPNEYPWTPLVSGDMEGDYELIDASGNVSGVAIGEINYYAPIPIDSNTNWGVAPQVGDFFRIDFDPVNKEEYEITRVADRDLQTDGLNPLLAKYIWKCSMVRRTPSKENVVGELQQEIRTNDSELAKDSIDKNNVAKDIFDYNLTEVDAVDKTNSDSVYGDY